MVLPDPVNDVVARLRAQGDGTGLLPAQIVATVAMESGLPPEKVDEIVYTGPDPVTSANVGDFLK